MIDYFISLLSSALMLQIEHRMTIISLNICASSKTLFISMLLYYIRPNIRPRESVFVIWPVEIKAIFLLPRLVAFHKFPFVEKSIKQLLVIRAYM